MPDGCSLWLCPPSDSAFYQTLTTLIHTTVPSRFPDLTPSRFPPHVTLTADTVPAADLGESPSNWLRRVLQDKLPPASAVKVRFTALDSEKPFFRKLTLRVEKAGDGAGIAALARLCRRVAGASEDGEAAERWEREEYRPHLSLLYADITILDDKLDSLKRDVEAAGVPLAEDISGMNGWEGGTIVLVPTYKSIDEWKPIAAIDIS